MSSRVFVRFLSLFLVMAMAIAMVPATAVRAEETGETAEPTASDEAVTETESQEVRAFGAEVSASEEETVTVEEGSEAEDEPCVTTYSDFIVQLKVLESYAASYHASVSATKDVNELVINFIRTGVDRYNDGNWKTLAGEEITAFTSYVETKAAEEGTDVMRLRNIEEFSIPNGQGVDFGHMFGTMNIAYISGEKTADLGGWAGDICDLMYFSSNKAVGANVEEMAAYILENCFGVDADDAFGMDDFYGDMDAFYLITKLKAGSTTLSALMEGYFTESLTDADRAEYFMKNRFSGLYTKDSVRAAIYDTYSSNVGLQVLEADRGLSDKTDLRQASCYAFADYLYQLAGDRLEEPDEEEKEEQDNPYYSVFSSTHSTLAPGITQVIHYAQTADDKQIVYYIATVDVSRDDVNVYANYKDADPSQGWGMARVTDQIAAAQAKHTNPEDTENYIENYNPIVGVNGDFYNIYTGQPSGVLVMDGVEYNKVNGSTFFAILKDGTPVIGTGAEYAQYAGQIQEAIGGSIMLVRDGKMVVSSDASYYSSRASRTCVGITADGKVVLMVLDGRQEPFSAGGSSVEIAQIMLDAGCVIAINLDGGGSTTYAAKAEGSDEISVINRPSDGYQRSVSTSLVVVSTAVVSNEFERANISTEYDYLTVGTAIDLTATGISASGNSAEVPENAVWQVSDSSIGTVADGKFTAVANGDVTVELVVDGEVVGSKVLHVVVPDAIDFEKDYVTAIYGIPVTLPLFLYYNGNPVAFNENDVYVGVEYEEAGTVEGWTFTGNEESGIRTVLCAGFLMADEDAFDITYINLYSGDEAFFDFENATAGNRTLAWNRDVINGVTSDNYTYTVSDPAEDMSVEYTFALDMSTIEIPEQLADLTSMLPGADTGTTAWGFLLNLAERVSVLTEVRVTAQFDMDVTVDCSGLKIINEYFYAKDAILDETTNTLTIICGWVDQTQAIDPATANPICILTGIKCSPKEGNWDSNNKMTVVNTGEVSYTIYLRANALFNFAQSESNQATYGLYPFDNPDVIIAGATEKGAYFGSTYATFEDAFALDKTVRQGWYEIDKKMYYFVDHVAVTGIQQVPSQDDASIELFYDFGEDGACIGTITGLIEKDGNLYYAVLGEMKTGWRSVYDADGNSFDYYFNPSTGAAVDGVQKIGGYTYTFTNYILTRGQFVVDANGTRYIWAGRFLRNQWLEFDGNVYCFKNDYYMATGFVNVRCPDLEYNYCLFDENGVFQGDYTGLYDVGADTYYLENGEMVWEAGIIYIDGYYYYIASNGKAVKNRSYWPTKTNGLVPVGCYYFDEYGRMTNPPATEPEQPEPEDPTPEEPEQPEVKDGLVYERGAWYYYKNGAIQYAAGLIQIDGNYYYVRSNGQLAIGNYWVTNNNGLLPSGMYTFDENGKMVIDSGNEEENPDSGEPETPETPETPEVKNGFYTEGGAIYYYVDGTRAYCAGLIYVDGYYYYVRSNAQVAVGSYWITNNNDLLPCGMYEFDEQGRMLNAPDSGEEETPDSGETETPEVLNGIVEYNGALYYFVDGKIAYGAGILKLTDENGADFYIYVRSNGQLAIGNYWPTTTNDLLPGNKMYNFGTNGRLYL